MTEETKQYLAQAGIRADQALERFMGNETLFERFLKKFPQDPNYSMLLEGMEERDEKKAFSAAHTLKGVAGNLSIQPVMEAASKLTECLRESGHLDEAAKLLPQLKEAYENAVTMINLL